MIVKRMWQVVSGEPMHVIKEDEFTYNWPEDLEELLDPDGLFVRKTPAGYKVIITSYYHASDTVVYFCIKGKEAGDVRGQISFNYSQKQTK